MNVEALVVDAFAQLGFDAVRAHDGPRADIGLVVDPDGVDCSLHVAYRSLVSGEVALRMSEESRSDDAVLLAVGDRVTEDARKLLTSRRGGYLDLRGRLALRSDRVAIDAEVDPVKERAARTGAFSGKAGLEVATALLLSPEHPAVVRGIARALGRAPSTVSEVLAGLRNDGLIDESNRLVGAELFWAVATQWSTPRVHLARSPQVDDESLRSTLRLGLDDVESEAGWALTDSVAAIAYGAPLATRSGQMLDFFVSDQSIVRRATTLLGAAASPTTA